MSIEFGEGDAVRNGCEKTKHHVVGIGEAASVVGASVVVTHGFRHRGFLEADVPP